jgi:hypothetical protein
MRIIENNYQDKEQEYEITCPHCKSKLAYRFDDVISDRFKGNWIDCPVCDKEISIHDSEAPTIEAIQYPQNFWSFANAVHVKDDEVNEWVKECINDLDKNTDFSYRASGDTIVFAYKPNEGLSEATVTVAKNYQEADVKIPRKNF